MPTLLRSRLSGCLTFLSTLALTSCQSDPKTSPERQPASTLRLTAPATVAALDSAEVRAEAEEATGSRRAVSSGVTWSSADPSIATISAVGIVRGVREGTVAVQGTWQPASNAPAQTVSVSLTVTPARVVSLRLRDSLLVLGRGSPGARPVIDLLNATGAVLPASRAQWQFAASGGVVQPQDSLVRGVGLGSAVVTATVRDAQYPNAAPLTATFAVQVVDGVTAPLGITPAVVRPGATIIVRSSGLRAGPVRADGVAWTVLVATDSVIQAQVPASAYAPCAPVGTSAQVQVPAATGAVTIPVGVEAPLAVTFAGVGVPVYPTAALARGCPLAVPATGSVVAYAYNSDPTYQYPFSSTLAPTIPVVVATGAAALTAAALLPAAMSAEWSGDSAPVASVASEFDDVLARVAAGRTSFRAFRAAAAAACTLPTTVGGEVVVWTRRSATDDPEPSYLAGAQKEPWTVIAVGERVLVLTDTGGMRRLTATGRQRYASLAAAVDSDVVPFFERDLGDTLPDADGDGRLILLAAGGDQSSNSGIASYLAVDGCGTAANPQNGIQGIRLGIKMHAGQTTLVDALGVTVHELAHVNDLLRPEVPFTLGRAANWPMEAYADMVRYLWFARGSVSITQAFTQTSFAPVTRTMEGMTSANQCAYPAPDAVPYFRSLIARPASYSLACQYLAWLIQGRTQGGAVTGVTALREWRTADVRSRLLDRIPASWGTNVGPMDRYGDFFASWVIPTAAQRTGSSASFPLFALDALSAPRTDALLTAALVDGVTTIAVAQPGVRFMVLSGPVATGARTISMRGASGSGLDSTQVRVGFVRRQ